jgi:hypothetical protein
MAVGIGGGTTWLREGELQRKAEEHGLRGGYGT